MTQKSREELARAIAYKLTLNEPDIHVSTVELAVLAGYDVATARLQVENEKLKQLLLLTDPNNSTPEGGE